MINEDKATQANAYACSHCKDCGFNNFPPTAVCPNCMSLAVDEQPLSREGVLYSFSSIQLDGGKAFVGYIDLPEAVRVFARLDTGAQPPMCDIKLAFKSSQVAGNGPQFIFGAAQAS